MEINTSEELKDKLTVKKGEKLHPKMIIYNVTQELEDEELVNCIVAQTDIGDEGEVKVLFKMKSNKGKNIVISFHHSAFNKLLRKGRVCTNYLYLV